MNNVWRTLILLGVASLVGSVASAQTGAPEDAKKRLIEQKIKLLDTLLNSPAAKKATATPETEAARLISQGNVSVERARTALAELRLDEASSALDEGMKAVSKATRRLPSETALSDSAQRKTYDDLSEQVASYRTSVAELTKDSKSGETARMLLARVDQLVAEARQLASGSRLGEANGKLAEAYKLATQGIAQMRQGQEVIMSLKFETPADEYAYEQKRFASNEIMVDMMINEGKTEGDRKRLVDGYQNEGRRLRREAEAKSLAGQYKEALQQMEKANDQMKRALQSLGVAVF